MPTKPGTSTKLRRGRKLTPTQRYATMSSIRSTNTKPEQSVRRALSRLGVPYRTRTSNLPGRPDLIVPQGQIAVMVHGCFWHQHSGCRLARIPKSRPDYWPTKLQNNKVRDQRASRALRYLGWRVITIWECQTFDSTTLAEGLRSKLANTLRVTRTKASTKKGAH